ncbi:PD-(D/E)XK nuclease family protein [Aquitalea sp. ASV11]|uniref:PDDEXK-like family protein n=1 Tax=Aquitalea sp. ASV11 TaxID=2795103 RepID=UPI0018EDDC35|nr:PD-(D/E)XK nuclease family protein [Aquitalea sp. ASV11]
MQNLIELIKGIRALPEPIPQEPNFFSIGGRGYLENPTSDLLAIFMGGLYGNTPTWLAKALVHCLIDRSELSTSDLEKYGWDDLIVEREVAINDAETDTYKRLDLLVSCSAFVLGIEFKVYASAANNPFDVYDQLLQNRADGRPILKCVLRPNSYAADIKSASWPVVSYDDLLAKAKQFYGSDVAFAPVSKWQFFYTELLQHLHQLAHPESDTLMDDKSFEFVLQNFSDLRKGRSLLDDFENQLLHLGVTVVSKALSELNVESGVKTAAHTWPDARALRFRPECWGQDSDVVLCYEETEDEDTSVGFYIRAYIRRGTEQVDFETISKQLCHVTHEKLDLWEEDGVPESEHCWYEQGDKYLCFGALAKDRSLDGTLQALASLTKWLQLNAYTAPATA